MATKRPKLKGKSIVLKRSKLLFKRELFQLLEAERERLTQFVPWINTIRNDLHMARWLQRMEAEWGTGKRWDYLIFFKDKEKKENVLVGNIACMNITAEDCELGFWLGQQYEGKGLTSEAINLLEGAIFGSLSVDKVTAKCDARNERCKALLLRNGYSLAPTQRRYRTSTKAWEDVESYTKLLHQEIKEKVVRTND